jgi:hypothetical protein
MNECVFKHGRLKICVYVSLLSFRWFSSEPRYSWNIAESGVNTKNQSICLQVYLNRWAYEDNVVSMTCLWQVYQIKR